MNAIGVLYYQAPDVFEQDPVRTAGWGSHRRDVKKAWSHLEKAASKDNLHASFNLGCLYLDSTDKDNFSLSKAYEKFKLAALRGHTISSYNVGVMHFLGIGTFKSCQVAIAFFKHVLTVGEESQKMKQAYSLVQSDHFREAAFVYMELAEAGYGTAALNLALLLEKNEIFSTERTLLGELAVKELGSAFDLNKQVAFRYLQMAMRDKGTEHEANFKIADFLYYGTSGATDFAQALTLYKSVEELTQDSNLRGHALFKLGMMHQFGNTIGSRNSTEKER